MKVLWRRLHSAWQALWRSRRLDAEMQEEMRFHIEMEAARLAREGGVDPHEARRQAHVRFGGIEKYKEHARDARAFQWVDVVSLDIRLALRMLVKYRGLTLVGGFAMAVAIAIGAGFFEIMTQLLNPALPFDDGAPVVALEYASAISGSPNRRVLHEFNEWRGELVSIEQLTAFRSVQHNLGLDGAPPDPIKVAEMTASGFVVTRTPPLLGRYLLPSDERDGAAPVVVIGHRAWESRFAGDAGIVGRTIRLDGIQHSIVGVMPDGFEFPVDHQFWVPLRADPLKFPRLQGPELYLLGRLAPGASIQQAQAELTAIGQRAAAVHPEAYSQLRPMVHFYTYEYLGLTSPSRLWLIRLVQLLVGGLSFIVAVNLAILLYARTVRRMGEIAVRTALGASRRRILVQLFIEASALTMVGAAAGLVIADLVLHRLQAMVRANGSLPFWIHFDLSAATCMYAFALAALAAVIMGVLPGLKATGIQLTANLHELNGRAGTRLGRLWTGLVVGQISVAVALLPWAVYLSWHLGRKAMVGPGFPAGKFVVCTVAAGDDGSGVPRSRASSRQLALLSRLQSEPGVTAATFSSSVPGFAGDRRIQFDDGVPAKEPGVQEVSVMDVDLKMFDAYRARTLAGRSFYAGDLGAAHTVVVNSTFVEQLLGSSAASSAAMTSASALGVRFRYWPGMTRPENQPQEWYQIVGVVADFPSFSPSIDSDGTPTVYHPAAPGDFDSAVLSLRFDGGVPDGIAARVRRIGAEIDPALQLRRVVPLSSLYDDVLALWRYFGWGIALVTASVLLLSAAGIYALMSFTLAERTREIGIRAALGASPHRLFLGILGRAARQLSLGFLAGTALSFVVFLNADVGFRQAAALMSTVALIMIVIGLLAALGPARRSLRIQAIDALRTDG